MKNTEQLIEETCESMKNLLLEKNRNYGDSATNPSNVFSSGSAVDSICARIDDKLMRIQNKGINDYTEDTVSDLIGYLILLKVALYKEKHGEYDDMSESIKAGGFCNINGTPIDNLKDLKYHYDIETEDNNNSI